MHMYVKLTSQDIYYLKRFTKWPSRGENNVKQIINQAHNKCQTKTQLV